MFDSPFYIIKKWNFWIPIPIKFCVFIPIAYILIPIIALIPMYLDYKKGEFEEDFIAVSIFFTILIIYWIFLLKEAIKIKRIKDIKYNWWWIVKKVKVTSIWKTKIKNGSSYKVIYYIEAEDWEMRYISNGSTKWVLLWTSMPELELLYAKYWFTFDEQERQKNALLKKIEELIAEKGYEIENSSLISKIIKGKQLWNLEVDKKIVSDWYIPTYWQIDENKVTVWDMVDVYIDPDNPKRYRVDTDFLF
jgi:uncharacterized membrane protein YhaH (DUF805 family)